MQGKVGPVFEKEMSGSIQHSGCIEYDRLLSEGFEVVCRDCSGSVAVRQK
jgi:hypothetical protein